MVQKYSMTRFTFHSIEKNVHKVKNIYVYKLAERPASNQALADCWRQWHSSSKGLSHTLWLSLVSWSGGLCGVSGPFVTTEFTSGHGVGLMLPWATEDTLLFLCSTNKAGHQCPWYTRSHWAIVELTNSQPKFHYIWIFFCRHFGLPSRVLLRQMSSGFFYTRPTPLPVITQDLWLRMLKEMEKKGKRIDTCLTRESWSVWSKWGPENARNITICTVLHML